MRQNAKKSVNPNQKRPRPAKTPEERENQLINLAYDLVEQRLLDGTATSQETTHFLRLGSTKERIEREKIEKENRLLEARVKSLESGQRSEELYELAIKAMKVYSGQEEDEEDDY